MCGNPDVLQITRIITILITIIRIIVPIILIVILSIRIIKGVYSSEEDETSKIVKEASKKVIIAIAIFLVPSIVNLMMKVISPDNEYRCFLNTTSEDVVVAVNNKAETLVEEAKEKVEMGSYNTALFYLDTISDEALKEKLSKELVAVKEKIDIIGQPENFTFYENESHSNVPKRAMTEDFDKDGVSDLVEWLFYDGEY